MKHFNLPLAVTFIAFGLATFPQSTRAASLTLNSGDTVSVNGTGTHGTINTATTNYDDSTSGFWAVETNDTSTFTLGAGGSLTNAMTNHVGLDVQGNGKVSVTGGMVTAGNNGISLYASGSGQVTVSGGTVTAGASGVGLYANGTRPMTVTVSGGTITAEDNGIGLYANGNGQLTVNGGTITAGAGGTGLYANGNGQVAITGGTIIGGAGSYGLYVNSNNSGPITITGGIITVGDNGVGFYVNGMGTIDMYGDFGKLLGTSQTLPSGAGSFYGTLENNTVGQTYTYDNFGTMTLHDVALTSAPEPSPVLVLALGLLSLGALILKKSRSSRPFCPADCG